MTGTVLRIGNCSGFYGDRLSAMREMLEGGPLDVLTGDYLAELTMLILGKDTLRDPSLGYARTFVRQLEDSLGLALERGVKIVANAGGLNPAGLAEAIRDVAQGLGLDPAVAHVEGDDLRSLGFPGALTANAYLGGHGIAAALRGGADVVVTGRVTDASVVVGPAVAHFGWEPTAYDALAGAVVAGHVIECGTQATGGNFSGFLALPGRDRPLGFPIAEVAADGSCVITKHDGTGGAVSVDTVTAQLLYEVQSERYLNPDVTTRLDTILLTQAGPDRVAITGVRGEPPPERLKVCINELGGFRNTMDFVLTGRDTDAKADWVRDQLESAWAVAIRPAVVEWSLSRPADPAADTEEAASRLLRCVVQDPSAEVAGKGFTGPAVELALASYPGFTMTAPPAPAAPYGIYRAEYVDRDQVTQVVVHADGRREAVPDAALPPAASAGGAAGETTPSASLRGGQSQPSSAAPPAAASSAPTETTTSASLRGGQSQPSSAAPPAAASSAPTETTPSASLRGGQSQPSSAARPAAASSAPTGQAGSDATFVHARSGDKGGDANLGLWVAHDGDRRYDARVDWLLTTITPDTIRHLIPESEHLEVDVHPLPNLGGVNVVIRGLLGRGVAASTRFDPQAKGLGEWARARLIDIPEELR